MLFAKLPEPRQLNGVTILGPDLFSKDDQGKLLTPIASAFPAYRTIVTGRGIHAVQAAIMLEFFTDKIFSTQGRGLNGDDENLIYQDAVALFVREPVVLIRSNPGDMNRIFAADELLQRIVPKERIQFTGIHLAEVREKVRWRGESWRISPSPRSLEEISRYIGSCRVQVNTGATYYHNAHTGGRFMTYGEFIRIRSLLHKDKEEALARLKEIIQLIHLKNDQEVHELNFFLPGQKDLCSDILKDLIAVLQSIPSSHTIARSIKMEEAERLYDRFAACYLETAGQEFTIDDENHAIWRTSMFCRLHNIDENTLEEWNLGLSPEFHLNVKWLPGVRILDGELLFEQKVTPRIRNLINHFWESWEEIVSINVGRVEAPQTVRDIKGEHREVYLVVLGMAGGCEKIRLLRMMKWDVMHRLSLGAAQDQAIQETIEYRDYIFNRLRAVVELGIPIPSFTEIRLEEDVLELGRIPVFFFDRCYISGMATDKIPSIYYTNPKFIVRLAHFLGLAAGATLVLGRAHPRSGHVFFDDGDEVIQLDNEGLPKHLVMSETTGSFTSWKAPVTQMLPHCLWHFAKHLEKAEKRNVGKETLSLAIDTFADGLVGEIERMQGLLNDPSRALWPLFKGHPKEPWSIRCRWKGVLKRLEKTDTQELRRIIAESSDLIPFKGEMVE